MIAPRASATPVSVKAAALLVAFEQTDLVSEVGSPELLVPFLGAIGIVSVIELVLLLSPSARAAFRSS